MSWHGKWHPEKVDPFSKPAKAGDVYGTFTVTTKKMIAHPHYGIRVQVKCSRCGMKKVCVLAQLRSAPPKTHRGCGRVT